MAEKKQRKDKRRKAEREGREEEGFKIFLFMSLGRCKREKGE